MGKPLDEKLQRLLDAFDDVRGLLTKLVRTLLDVGGRYSDLQLIAENRAAMGDAIRAARQWVYRRLLLPLEQHIPNATIYPWKGKEPPSYLVLEEARNRFRGTLPEPPVAPQLSIADIMAGYPTHAIAIVGISVVRKGGVWSYQLVSRPIEADSGDAEYTWELWLRGHFMNGGVASSPDDVARNVRDCIQSISGIPAD